MVYVFSGAYDNDCAAFCAGIFESPIDLCVQLEFRARVRLFEDAMLNPFSKNGQVRDVRAFPQEKTGACVFCGV